MKIEKLNKVTIVRAENNMFLKLQGELSEHSEEIIGKPIEMVFDNSGKIPEFEEITLQDLNNNV